LADELGFEYGFCVEHHFRPDESWMSAPNLYTVAAAARTRRIRLGAMGHIVPLHHPLRLAERNCPHRPAGRRTARSGASSRYLAGLFLGLSASTISLVGK
jgi:hypothetical protein